MPPQQQNQYDFIMDNGNKSGGLGSSFLQNPKNKIVVSILFVSIVLILVIVAFNVVSNLGKANNDDLVDLMARQTEIVRISELGLDDADSQAVKTKLATLNSIMKSDYRVISGYLTRVGHEIEPLKLKVHFDSSVEEDLETAKSSNRLDSALLELIDEETTNYKSALRKALDATTTPGREETLNTAATNIIIYDGKETASN